jgi:hypothetical protein
MTDDRSSYETLHVHLAWDSLKFDELFKSPFAGILMIIFVLLSLAAKWKAFVLFLRQKVCFEGLFSA